MQPNTVQHQQKYDQYNIFWDKFNTSQQKLNLIVS